jgi:hypothetical protein
MAILPEDFPGHALRVSGEVTAHGTVRSIVGLNHVAFAGLDRMREAAAKVDADR